MEQKNKGSCITFWMRGWRSAQPAPKTWCSTTKEQDFAGSEAPRLVRRQRLGPQRRGARRRKNKGLREAEHHVRYVGGALSSEDVVLDDEGTRFCGRRSTTPPRRSPARRPAARKLQTTGAGTVPSPTAAGPRPAASGLAVRQQPQLPPGGSSKKDRRTVGPPNPSTSPTSPSGFSWSSSWIAAFSGFWHVPARYGRSAADPWSRTGSNNSCC